MANTKKLSLAVAFLKTHGFAVITDSKKLDSEMRELSTAIKTQDARIALYLLSEIVHIEQHRNPTRLNTFFTSISRAGTRVDAMHKFIQLFANVKFVDAGKRKDPIRDTAGNLVTEFFYEVNAVRSEEVAKAKLEQAITKPWTEWKAPPKPQDFTLAGQIKQLIERATKRVAEPVECAETDINMELLTGLEKLADSFGIKYTDALKEAAAATTAANDVAKKTEDKPSRSRKNKEAAEGALAA